MDIGSFKSRRDSQAALVAKTEADLATAVKNKWALAQRELKVRLARQKNALANTDAIIAEISAGK